MVALAFVLGILATWIVGDLLSRPALRAIGDPPHDLGAQRVEIAVPSASPVAGWWSKGQSGAGVLLLLHGVRSDRTQMLARARFLRGAGYGTLLIDLPAHGESSGERITFGARESAGVVAALAFLRSEAPAERVGVIGVSLGAASTVLAHPQPSPEAVVLESMYASIDAAVRDRLAMRLGRLGAPLAPMLLWQLPLRTGIDPSALRPIDHLAQLHAPVLIASGAEDRHTPWAATERLFDVAHEPKALWRVEGAAHVDLHAFAPVEYERRILAFFARHLRETR